MAKAMPDAEGKTTVRVFPAERVAHAPCHAVRHDPGFLLGGNVLQKGDEFVAAGAGQEIPAAKLFFKYFREAGPARRRLPGGRAGR